MLGHCQASRPLQHVDKYEKPLSAIDHQLCRRSIKRGLLPLNWLQTHIVHTTRYSKRGAQEGLYAPQAVSPV